MISLILVAAILAVLYLYGTRIHRYWKDKGVKHEAPVPFWGNNARNFLVQKSTAEVAADVYKKYPTEKIVGFYRGSIPELVIRDPGIAKQILVKDFESFYLRGTTTRFEAKESLMRNLYSTDDKTWQPLRQCLSSAFTTNKIRGLFPVISKCGDKLQMHVDTKAAAGQPLDARGIMAQYTTDIIGSCGFGLEADYLKDVNSTYRKLTSGIFDVGAKKLAILNLKLFFPSILKHFNTMKTVEKNMNEIVGKVLQQRNYEPSGKFDFLDHLLECKKKGAFVTESIEVDKNGNREMVTLEMSEELIIAQLYVFISSAFESLSNTTSYALNELAHNPKVQDKVQEEIERVLAKYNGKLCYEAIDELTYLKWTLQESMRLFPSLGYLMRECARTYTLKDLNVTIDKGVRIFVPIQAMHNDPEYFENPEEFRPDRFDPTVFDDKKKQAYMPYGLGPRSCIGQRLGMMQCLVGMVALLSKFRVSPAPDTPRRPTVNPASSVVQSIVGGLPLIFEPRATLVN